MFGFHPSPAWALLAGDLDVVEILSTNMGSWELQGPEVKKFYPFPTVIHVKKGWLGTKCCLKRLGYSPLTFTITKC